jgi:hypothetical protein
MVTYIQGVPEDLKAVHIRGGNGPRFELLTLFVTDSRMLPVWRELSHRSSIVVRAVAPIMPPINDLLGIGFTPHQEIVAGAGIRLYQEVIALHHVVTDLALVQKAEERQSEERDRYLRIAEQARALYKAIENSPLDKFAYEYFLAETLEDYGIPARDDSNVKASMERKVKADNVLPGLPPMIELLSTLAADAQARGEAVGEQARIVSRRRPRANAEDGGAPDGSTAALHFVRALAEHFNHEYGLSLCGTVAHISNFFLGTTFDADDVKKRVRGVPKGGKKPALSK